MRKGRERQRTALQDDLHVTSQGPSKMPNIDISDLDIPTEDDKGLFIESKVHSKEETNKLHDFIVENNLEDIKYFTDIYKSKLYLNSAGESALLTAIKNKRFGIYVFLKSIGLTFKNKREEVAINELTAGDKAVLTELMLAEFPHANKAHVFHLLSKSRSINYIANFEERIEHLYRHLDGIPEVSIILKILQYTDDLDIAFDFDREKIKNTDLGAADAIGNIPDYKNGKIEIATNDEKLLLGTLAHHLAFVAMYILFKNDHYKFSIIDNIQSPSLEDIMIKIKEKYKMFNDDEYKQEDILFRASHYSEEEQNYALLARVPQILAQHSNSGREMLATQESMLLDYYNNQEEGGLSQRCKEFIQNSYLINPKNRIQILNERLGNVHDVIKYGINFANRIDLNDFLESENQVLLVETENTSFSILRIYESLIKRNKDFSLQDTLFFEVNTYIAVGDTINKAFYSSASKVLCISFSQGTNKNKIPSVLQSLNRLLKIKQQKRIILILHESEIESLGITKNIFNGNYKLVTKHTFSFNDFTKESQQNILERQILFQGQQIRLSNLIDISDDSAKEAIDTKTLFQITMGKKIEIGPWPSDASHLEGAYSKMYEEVDIKTFVSQLLSNISNVLYIISGMSGSLKPESLIKSLIYEISDIKVRLEVNNLASQIGILNEQENTKSLHEKIQVTDDQFKQKDFIQFCHDHSTCKIYWIHLRKENNESKFMLQQIYNPYFYIGGKRFNREVVMDKNIVEELCSTTLSEIFIINTKHKRDFIDWLHATYEQVVVLNRHSINRKIHFVTSQDDGEHYFKESVNANEKKSVHFLLFERSELIWCKSYGSRNNINKYRAEDHKNIQPLMDEDDVFKEIQEKKVAIITGDPGTGKSTTLAHLYNAKCASKSTPEETVIKSHWVIEVHLKQHLRAINEIIFYNEKVIDEITMFLMQLDINKNNDLTNSLVQGLLRMRLEKDNLGKPLFIIFDGFDEVLDKANRLKIISLLQILKDKTCVKFCIATRLNYKSDLEGALSTFALKLEPMDEAMIRIFISKLFKNNLSLTISEDKSAENFDSNGENVVKFTDAFLRNMQTACKSQAFDFIGTPLQLYLMFEGSVAYLKEWINKNSKVNSLDFHYLGRNIWEVYDYFVDRKLDIVCKQIGVQEKRQKKEMKDRLEKYHMDLAKVLLNIKPSMNESFKHFQDMVSSVGVIRSDENNIDFIHPTFAEYYTSKKFMNWIVKWKERSNHEFTNFQKMQYFCTKILLKSDFRLTRVFLDIKFLEERTKNVRLREQYYATDILSLAAKENHVGIARFVFDNFPGVNVNGEDSRGYVALDIAVKYGHKNIIEWLIDSGADVNAFTKDGQSVLHRAAARGKVDIVTWLVENRADINGRNKAGETVLNVTAANGHLQLVKWLVERGVDVSVDDNNGCRVLHHAVSRFGNLMTVEWLVMNGADIKAVTKDGRTVLHEAAASGQLHIVKWLVKKGAVVNVDDNDGWTVLHWAVTTFGNLKTVEWLVMNGANIKAVAKDGRTVLHVAAGSGQLDIVKWLVEKGADNNVVDDVGWSVLHYVVSKYVNLETVEWLVTNGANTKAITKDGRTVLNVASANGQLELVKWLVKRGAGVDVVDNHGWTILHWAVTENGNLETVEWLVTNGANTKAITQNGGTVLHVASANGQLELVKWLVKRGANVNEVDYNGSTVLHWAVSKNGNLETVEWLVANGANTKAITQNGGTVLHVASANGQLELVKWLVKRGANVNEVDYNGSKVLHWAVSKNGNLETVEWLVANGANIKAVTKAGQTVLQKAAANKKTEIISFLRNIKQ